MDRRDPLAPMKFWYRIHQFWRTGTESMVIAFGPRQNHVIQSHYRRGHKYFMTFELKF